MLMEMRLDIKKVKNNKYIQFVDSHGNVFHVGPASELHSWLVGMLLMDKQRLEEYYEKREDFFDKIVCEIANCIVLDHAKLEAIDAIRSQKLRYSMTQSTRVPKLAPFGELNVNDNIKQTPISTFEMVSKWDGQTNTETFEWNLFQAKAVGKKYQKSNLFTKKKIDIINQLKIMRETTSKEQNTVLSVLKEMEKETGIVEKATLLDALTMKCKFSKEEAERILTRLLRQGEIYEPKEECFKIT
jgi:hypothetical protein